MGHMFYIGLYRKKHETIFLSETTRHRALIFSMYRLLVDLYQVCSNCALGAKKVPSQGHMLYKGWYRRKMEILLV